MSTKISQLPQLTAPANADYIPVVQASSSSTKYILLSDLMKIASAIPNNTITAAMLATNAITLGFASISGSFNTTSTSPVQVTGLTVTVTIPSGSRKVRITAYCPNLGSSASPKMSFMTIWDGAVGSGTSLVTAGQLQGGLQTPFSSACVASVVVSPSAGSKTYNVGLASDGGGGITAWMTLSNAAPLSSAYILVEAV